MEVCIKQLNLSKGLFPEALKWQFEFRKNDVFIGQNFCGVGNVEEPFGGNRPLREKADKLIKKEVDNLYSLNLPLIFKDRLGKTNYNLLVNSGSIPTIIHLKFKNKISSCTRLKLKTLFYDAMYKTLLDLEIPQKAISFLNNDILLNGKKIAGGESTIQENIFSGAAILTLKYKEEKDIFDRLSYGKTKPLTSITGILDEFELTCTKQKCIQLLRDNLEYYLNEIIQENPLDE